MARFDRIDVAKKLRNWIRLDLWPLVYEETRQNLHGRLMKRRTGKTWRDVKANSGPTDRGLKLETTQPGLIAWMKGSTRRAFFVRPVHAKALRWYGDKKTRGGRVSKARGNAIFSRGHIIPAWRFRPVRPVFEDAIERAAPRGELKLRKRIANDLRVTFRGGKLTIRIPWGASGAATTTFRAK